MNKRCKKCRTDKPLVEFYRDNVARDGHRPECKACTSERRKAWYQANREREIARVIAWQQRNRDRYNDRQRAYKAANRGKERAGHLQRRFGLTPEDYSELLERQGGRCLICRRKPGKVSLHIDHDHTTGEIRGLLCFRCNGGLGQFGERPDPLARAVEYLLDGAGSIIEADELIAAARTRALALGDRAA